MTIIQQYNRKNRLARGFTLVELMVTVSIIGILAAIAIPNFQSMLQANRIQGAAAEFQSGLAMARAEAIKRGGDARVTLLANSITAGVPNWNAGFTVFYDTTTNANGEVASTVSTNNTLMQTVGFSSSVAMTSGSQTYVMFNGLGRSILTTNAFQAQKFSFGPASGAVAGDYRCIIMSATGRTRSAKYTTAAFAALTPANECPTY